MQWRRLPVPCPGVDCTNTIASAECELLLSESPGDVALFRQVEAEASIPSERRFYCPNPVCSAPLLLDAPAEPNDPLYCAACGSKVCAFCRTVWHKGASCDEYQALPDTLRQPEDLALLHEARRQRWRQCAQCEFMIERAEGCNHMTCKCGFEFCYACGTPWKKGSDGASQQACGCQLFEVPRELEGEAAPPLDAALARAMAQETAANDGRRYLPGQRRPVPDDIPLSVPDEHVPVYKTVLCGYHPGCRRGERCWFAHGEHELRRFSPNGSQPR